MEKYIKKIPGISKEELNKQNQTQSTMSVPVVAQSLITLLVKF